MGFGDIDWLSVLLRTLVYAGTIAAAGGVLARVTLDLAHVSSTLNRQIGIGILLLLICEPARYLAFQLAIAQGDWTLAFDPTMRWMAMETPLGQAAGIRILAAGAILIGFLWTPVGVAGALAMIGSYLIEGHTASSNIRSVLVALLFAHLLVAHWWLAALVPLRRSLADVDTSRSAGSIDSFGRKALAAVPVLAIAGAVTLLVLAGGKLDLASAYQQGFAIKLVGFTAILLIAAINKLRWTPLLVQDPHEGRAGLRTFITIEIGAAATILLATALATSFPPYGH